MIETTVPPILFRRNTHAAVEAAARYLAEVSRPNFIKPGSKFEYFPERAPGDQIKRSGVAPQLLNAKALTPSQVSEYSTIADRLHRHKLEIARKMSHTAALPDGEAKTRQAGVLKQIYDAIEAHPLSKSSTVSELANEVEGYGKYRGLKDSFWRGTNKVTGFMQENRWSAVPATAGVLTLKLTVGLWMLHQFDKLFGTKSVQGKPFEPLVNNMNPPPMPAPSAQPARHKQRAQAQAPVPPAQQGPPPEQAMDQAFNAPLYVQGQPQYMPAAYGQMPQSY